jgi:hypothetical protein
MPVNLEKTASWLLRIDSISDKMAIMISELSQAEVPRGGVAIALEGFSSLDGPDARYW